jgi:trans-aconitate 2-methyltransferase
VDTWNPQQYGRFQAEREQPFLDLLALVQPARSMRVVDLGCGTGSLTRRFHETLGAVETIGIDRSDRMLTEARRDPAPEGLRFDAGSIESFAADGAYDLIVSNAAFHWVEDHPALIRRLHAALKPGGQLAFQLPAMHDAITHTLCDELARSEQFRQKFGGWTRPQPVLEPEQYTRVLFRAGFPEPKVRVIVYPHLLAGREEVVDWVKGSLLTEYEKRLSPEQFAQFTSEYRNQLLLRLPDERPFLFPFRRLFCWGRKALH